MVVLTFNPSTGEEEEIGSEFKVCLVYIASFKTTRAT